MLREIVIGTASTFIGGVLLGLVAYISLPVRWRWQGRNLQRLIANNRRFHFVYNPTTEAKKDVTFLQDGQIGMGRNQNEHYWRIKRGRLEILAADKGIYSRFRYDGKDGYLRHTNDPDLRSIAGQYMIPSLVPICK